MKINSFKTYVRVGWLALAALAVSFGSCTREDQPNATEEQAAGAVSQARSYYESTARPLTRTVGGEVVPIKPLPGNFTPQWSGAQATVSSDGSTAWVHVPIQASVTYTAVRGGGHHHEAGETCGHDHAPVQVLQRLSILTDAAGQRQCLIATIVPEAESFADADHFSGFVSYHDLRGALVRVEKYADGTMTRSVEATVGNEAAVLEVVENAVLYPVATATNQSIATKADGSCKYCKKTDCKAKDQRSLHCVLCNRYDNPTSANNSDSECICARCANCGQRGQKCHCDNPSPTPCPTCHLFTCNGHGSAGESPDPVLNSAHWEMVKALFGSRLTKTQLWDVQSGSHYADRSEFQGVGSEYMHNLYVYRQSTTQESEYEKLRNYFIKCMRNYVQDKSYFMLGEGLHPILDGYLMVNTRVDMLNYYSYEGKANLVDGMNLVPYTISTAACTEAVLAIWNTLNAIGASASDAQIGGVFDSWMDGVRFGMN